MPLGYEYACVRRAFSEVYASFTAKGLWPEDDEEISVKELLQTFHEALSHLDAEVLNEHNELFGALVSDTLMEVGGVSMAELMRGV